MNKLKISQIQFQAKATPDLNAKLLKKYFEKTLKFKPDLICTPECSNIITNDKSYLLENTTDEKHLVKYATIQKDCPLIFEAKKFARLHNVNIHLGSLLLKIENRKKLVNRSLLINQNGKIKIIYDKIHLFDVNINTIETHRESDSFINIPMDGFNESYNISVSCAIIMNQIISQAKKQNKLTYLNKKEMNDLRLEWYIKSIRNSSKVIKNLIKKK